MLLKNISNIFQIEVVSYCENETVHKNGIYSHIMKKVYPILFLFFILFRIFLFPEHIYSLGQNIIKCSIW